jgi:hypothetical protein
LRAKFAAYCRYSTSTRAARDYNGFPTILVVTAGPGAEERLAGAIVAVKSGQDEMLPVLLTTAGLMETVGSGVFGPIWRSPECRRRQRWPQPGGVRRIASVTRPQRSPRVLVFHHHQGRQDGSGYDVAGGVHGAPDLSGLLDVMEN